MREYEDLLALMTEAFNEVFDIGGIEFGSTTSVYKGVHDGTKGAQWNMGVNRNNLYCRLGVNLEGLAYDGCWPMAVFIENEMKEMSLPLLRNSEGASDIVVELYRDAWQFSGRPPIVENPIGGSGILLLELTNEKWYGMLREAYQCLAEDKAHRGRAKQTVTLLKSGEKKEMWVSPHLNVNTVICQGERLSKDAAILRLLKAKDILRPVYDVVKTQSGE